MAERLALGHWKPPVFKLSPLTIDVIVAVDM